MLVTFAYGISVHWTGLFDYITGLDYWSELIPFFGQIPLLIFIKKPTLYKTDK